jgi:hypothetical protein
VVAIDAADEIDLSVFFTASRADGQGRAACDRFAGHCRIRDVLRYYMKLGTDMRKP